MSQIEMSLNLGGKREREREGERAGGPARCLKGYTNLLIILIRRQKSDNKHDEKMRKLLLLLQLVTPLTGE